MFRGKTFLTSAAVLAVIGLTSSAYGVTTKSRKQKQNIDQPSQEEFYSTADGTISPEARRQADGLRVKTIASIQSLLKDKKVKRTQRFELQLRIGELHAERHDYIRDEELSEFETKHDQWLIAGKKGPEPKLSLKRSKAQLTLAANAFRKLVREFPKHARTPAALYALGKTLARLENENSVLYFTQLIRDYKSHPLVTDAYLSLGEYYFEKHRIKEAITAYEHVLKNKKHKAYNYAIYKLGWAYFNATPKNDQEAREFIDKSVTSFKLVIRLDEKAKHVAGRINLRDEAVKDLIMVWAETEDTETAWQYFKTIGEQNSFYALLETLGSIYTDQGRNKEAITVYARLLREASGRTKNPEIYAKLVSLHDAQGDTKAVLADLTDMQKTYVKTSTWTFKHTTDQAAQTEARRIVEFNLHRFGTLYHSRGTKSKNKALMATAAEIYTLYLTSFPDNANAYDVRFYLAEIMLDFEKYDVAADHYTAVALAKPKDGKFLKPAATSAVLAMSKLDGKQKYEKVPPLGQVPQPLAIPAVKKKLVEVVDNYVRLLPGEKNGHPMRFTAAETFFRFGHYDVALERFQKLADELPQTEQGTASVKMIIGYYAEKKDWETTVKLTKKYIDDKRYKDKKLKDHLYVTMKNAMYNEALSLAKREKNKEAGQAFLAFQKEFPADANADRALYNASGSFFKGGMLELAIEANLKLAEKYPQSPLNKDVLVDIAQTYEALAQYERAAEYYKRFTVAYPRDEKASTALHNAATLYKGLKNYGEAEALFTRYTERYIKNKLVVDVKHEIAELREKLQRPKDAVRAYRDYADAVAATSLDQSYLGQAKAAEITYTSLVKTEGRQQIERLKNVLMRDKKTPAIDARRIVAQILFNEIDPSFINFSNLAVSDAAKIEEEVKRKQARLLVVAKMYEGVMAVSSPEYNIASLYRLGQMHEGFSKTLFNAPPPKGASQAEIDKFKSTIEKVAFNLKEEAYQFYESAFKQSQDVETFTAWTQRTYQKMAELAPGKHPEVVEQSTRAEYMGHELTIEDAVSGLVQ